MRIMDDLSPLLQQVTFRESWRGYDPHEVDAYVDQVAKSVAWARGQIDTLQERVEAAETLSDEVGDPQPEIPASPESPEYDGSQTPEGLARTLALAQSAADDAIAEARQQAEQMVVEAEQMVVEAEQMVAEAASQAEATISGAQAEASQIRGEADEYAESTFANVENLAKEREAAAATAEREKYVSEIAELTAHRSLLAEDLELLERHVVEQRKEIERSLSKLTDLVTSPETFRTSAAPSSKVAEPVLGGAVEVEMSDTAHGYLDESDDFDADDDLDDSDDFDADDDLDDSDDFDADDDLDDSDDFDADDDLDDSDVLGAEDDSGDSDVLGAEDGSGERADAEPDDEVDLDASAVFDDEIDPPLLDEATDVGDDDSVASFDSGHGQPRFVTAADLEAQRSVGEPAAPHELEENCKATSQLFDEDDWPQAVAQRPEEEPFLVQLREAASRDNVRMDTDDALSAFFNQEEDQRRSPWFLGGR